MAMDQLGALLDKNPGLASCVRCLELRDIKARLVEGDAIYVSIAGLINQLSNVKKLLLFDVDWDALSVSLELALTRMFKAPSVTEVVLENFGIATFADLTSLLSHLANLKVLKVVGLSCWDWSAPNHAGATGSPPPSGPIQLDKLVFDRGAFLSWFRQADCPFRLENLRHLQAFQFRHCAGKLHPVSLLQQVDLGNFHLGYTPNLRSLKLVNIDQND
ncbi:hypothetical protein BT96DRAFT_944997 [Gymnopus androsaceus JB14]|uniref:RNI-like protein n=1 Tax=Gymnopus androsaceus JB14 TaxID=1447944 RepID=A0A6A4H492_9AGAR|nr:hypothetical protein BT96DRAFT_944997 [Gymnopus androsaceus JB14]